MDYIEKQISLLNKKIDIRIIKLKRNISEIRKQQREDEFIYGFGGAYSRREKAINKREREIINLKEFEKQIKKPVIATEIIFSAVYCKECHSEILTKGIIREGWHECPVCQKMIYGKANKKVLGIVAEKYL
jgi:formylmethanofuran dehydrogenase subunit E